MNRHKFNISLTPTSKQKVQDKFYRFLTWSKVTSVWSEVTLVWGEVTFGGGEMTVIRCEKDGLNLRRKRVSMSVKLSIVAKIDELKSKTRMNMASVLRIKPPRI